MTCIFPNEIIHSIMQNSSQKSVYQWIFVCKYWSDIATHMFYKSVTLSEERLRQLIRQLHCHKRQVGNTNGLLKNAHLIGELKIQNEWRRDYIGASKGWSLFLRLLPNLKVLDIARCPSRLAYIIDLCNIKFEYVKGLERIITYHLEDIHFMDPGLTVGYLQACYRFRNTLTHMQVFDINRVSAFRPSSSANFSQYLTPYKKLTHITIAGDEFIFPFSSTLTHVSIYCCNKDLTDERIRSDLIKACPKVTFCQIFRVFRP